MDHIREFPLRVLFEQSRDVPGCWDATILELDAVTTGTSLVNAMEMAADMASQLIVDDLNHDREPMRTPDPEAGMRWARVIQDGALVADAPAFASLAARATCMSAMLTLKAIQRVLTTQSPVRPIATTDHVALAHY